ncbi:MAG: ShlB/FhaC/HecB family hemolysin secretion/activation protein [Victivallales bacterium]|nr:ShlB/FhaC/HecB family hemolysin secretion/activation protein [Victivallales bacterium]
MSPCCFGVERIESIRLSGDAEVAEALPSWPSCIKRVVGEAVSAEVLEGFRADLLSALRDAGYLFATVDFPEEYAGDGVVVAQVHCGSQGEIRIRKAGRHYTPRQVISRLTGRGHAFNYAEFCQRLAKANSGDLKIDVTLKPVYRGGRLEVDAEVDYVDRLPIHASMEVANTAAPEAASPLQLRLGLQALNLARCDDTLSLFYLTDGDLAQEVNAFYGAYQLPLGETWTATAFASWSDSTYSEVVRDLELQGRGTSYGLQFEHEMYTDGRVRATVAFGWRMARTRNRLQLYGDSLKLCTTRVSMPYLTLGYSENAPDRFHGQNFAALTLTGNFAGRLGSSDQRAFHAEGRGADGSFAQLHLSSARLQRFFAGEEHPGCWSLFARLQGLYSTDAAPNAAREYLGGRETVRGYREAEASGDTYFAGTLELRTPLTETRQPHESRWFLPQLLGALFTDFGLLKSHGDHNAPQNGRHNRTTLLAAGAGLRLAFGKYCHATVDYALPLCRHATPDTPRHGRWHLAVQFQF